MVFLEVKLILMQIILEEILDSKIIPIQVEVYLAEVKINKINNKEEECLVVKLKINHNSNNNNNNKSEGYLEEILRIKVD